MTSLKQIPESGQLTERVTLFEIDWSGAVRLIRELRETFAVRSLIINDRFSINESVLVDGFLQWARTYMLYIHFNHYQRLGVNMSSLSPAKMRSFYSESLPELFIDIVRHLARPRILLDQSLALPDISKALPICDGTRWGGLPAVENSTPLRNLVTAGPPLPVLQAVVIGGVPISYRPRLYDGLRRNFGGLKFENLNQKEGLVPCRLTYWNDADKRFYTLLDQNIEFEAKCFRADTLLQHITFDVSSAFVPPEYEPPPPPPADKTDQKQVDEHEEKHQRWLTSQAAAFRTMFPSSINWLGWNLLLGARHGFSAIDFLRWQKTMIVGHPNLTLVFVQTEFLASIGEDLQDLDFPKLGTVAGIDEIRVLVNDLGQGPADVSRGTARRSRRRKQKKKNGVPSSPEDSEPESSEAREPVGASSREEEKSEAVRRSGYQRRKRESKR